MFSSGLPLSKPLPIVDLVNHYPTNNLIERRLILWHNLSENEHSNINPISGISLSFPRLFQTKGQINDVLRNFPPVTYVP